MQEAEKNSEENHSLVSQSSFFESASIALQSEPGKPVHECGANRSSDSRETRSRSLCFDKSHLSSSRPARVPFHAYRYNGKNFAEGNQWHSTENGLFNHGLIRFCKSTRRLTAVTSRVEPGPRRAVPGELLMYLAFPGPIRIHTPG